MVSAQLSARAFTLQSAGEVAAGKVGYSVQLDRGPKVRIPATAALCLLVLTLSAVSPALYGQAQAFNASLTGTIYDNTGAAVPGARVGLSNPAHGFDRTLTSGADGHYSFALLPPGTYTLKVEASGFRTYSQ